MWVGPPVDGTEGGDGSVGSEVSDTCGGGERSTYCTIKSVRRSFIRTTKSRRNPFPGSNLERDRADMGPEGVPAASFYCGINRPRYFSARISSARTNGQM